MSKKEFSDLSHAQRVEYARKVKSLRQSAGMTQLELANAAGISRATLIDLENGGRTPQSENIMKVLKVFGVDVEAHRFEEQTELWLSMMGALIEAIPEQRKVETVNQAIRVLSDGVSGRGIVRSIKQNVGKKLVDIRQLDKAASSNHDGGEPDTP